MAFKIFDSIGAFGERAFRCRDDEHGCQRNQDAVKVPHVGACDRCYYSNGVSSNSNKFCQNRAISINSIEYSRTTEVLNEKRYKTFGIHEEAFDTHNSIDCETEKSNNRSWSLRINGVVSESGTGDPHDLTWQTSYISLNIVLLRKILQYSSRWWNINGKNFTYSKFWNWDTELTDIPPIYVMLSDFFIFVECFIAFLPLKVFACLICSENSMAKFPPSVVYIASLWLFNPITLTVSLLSPVSPSTETRLQRKHDSTQITPYNTKLSIYTYIVPSLLKDGPIESASVPDTPYWSSYCSRCKSSPK